MATIKTNVKGAEFNTSTDLSRGSVASSREETRSVNHPTDRQSESSPAGAGADRKPSPYTKHFWYVFLFAALAGAGPAVAPAWGGEVPAARAEAPAAVSSPPPIPLHNIEGAGGVGLTELAYPVNPSCTESPFGLPAFSATHVQARHKNVEILSVSQTLWNRLELSYAHHYVGLGDFADDVKSVTGAELSRNDVRLHNLNARLLLLNEGAYDAPWVPAVTAGVHYKYNSGIDDIDRDLGGALTNSLGVEDNQGVDYTLTATKLFKNTPLKRPVFISGTARNTDAAQLGWLGFTGRRVWTLEGNTGVFVTNNLILAAEYRQKPDQLGRAPGVLGEEDDWWSLAASYIVNNRVNISAAYANLGTVVNHEEPAALWLQLKIEL